MKRIPDHCEIWMPNGKLMDKSFHWTIVAHAVDLSSGHKIVESRYSYTHQRRIETTVTQRELRVRLGRCRAEAGYGPESPFFVGDNLRAHSAADFLRGWNSVSESLPLVRS